MNHDLFYLGHKKQFTLGRSWMKEMAVETFCWIRTLMNLMDVSGQMRCMVWINKYFFCDDFAESKTDLLLMGQ